MMLSYQFDFVFWILYVSTMIWFSLLVIDCACVFIICYLNLKFVDEKISHTISKIKVASLYWRLEVSIKISYHFDFLLFAVVYDCLCVCVYLLHFNILEVCWCVTSRSHLVTSYLQARYKYHLATVVASQSFRFARTSAHLSSCHNP